MQTNKQIENTCTVKQNKAKLNISENGLCTWRNVYARGVNTGGLILPLLPSCCYFPKVASSKMRQFRVSVLEKKVFQGLRIGFGSTKVLLSIQ